MFWNVLYGENIFKIVIIQNKFAQTIIAWNKMVLEYDLYLVVLSSSLSLSKSLQLKR